MELTEVAEFIGREVKDRFPEGSVLRAAAGIEARLATGEYDNLDEITLTELLTEHLQAATDDRHLRVGLGGPAPRRVPEDERPDRETRRAMMRQRGGLDNFGIRRVERLDGNVGLIDLRRMAMAENAGPAIAAAMELVAGTYALIIDLRRNGGGSPHGVALWAATCSASARCTSTTSSTRTAARPASSGASRSCRAPGTWTSRCTC